MKIFKSKGKYEYDDQDPWDMLRHDYKVSKVISIISLAISIAVMIKKLLL